MRIAKSKLGYGVMVVTSDFGSESPGSNPGSPTKYSFARET